MGARGKRKGQVTKARYSHMLVIHGISPCAFPKPRMKGKLTKTSCTRFNNFHSFSGSSIPSDLTCQFWGSWPDTCVQANRLNAPGEAVHTDSVLKVYKWHSLLSEPSTCPVLSNGMVLVLYD